MEKNKERTKKLPPFRFMAMSKLIGIVAFIFVSVISIYSMYEMHISQNYDSMPQLIISAFGFASVYAGFYLVMAKVEHLEEEKTKREKELLNLKKKNATSEEMEAKQEEINALRQKMLDTINESITSVL